MKLFIPVVFVGLLISSCETSRVASESQPTSAAPEIGTTTTDSGPKQLSDTKATLNPKNTEVYRPEGSQGGQTLQAPETK